MPLSTPEIELESYFDALLHEPSGADKQKANFNATISLAASREKAHLEENVPVENSPRETSLEGTNYSAKQKRFLRRLELAQMGRVFSRSPGAKKSAGPNAAQNPSRASQSALSCRLFRYFDRRIAIPLKDIVSVVPLEQSQVLQLVGQHSSSDVEVPLRESHDGRRDSTSPTDVSRDQPVTPEARAKTVEALHALLDDADQVSTKRNPLDPAGFSQLQLINSEAFSARYTGSETAVLVRLRGRSGRDLGILVTAALAKSRLQLNWFRFPVGQDHGLGSEVGSGVIGAMRMSGEDARRSVEASLLLFDAGQYFRSQYAKKVLAPDSLS